MFKAVIILMIYFASPGAGAEEFRISEEQTLLKSLLNNSQYKSFFLQLPLEPWQKGLSGDFDISMLSITQNMATSFEGKGIRIDYDGATWHVAYCNSDCSQKTILTTKAWAPGSTANIVGLSFTVTNSNGPCLHSDNSCYTYVPSWAASARQSENFVTPFPNNLGIFIKNGELTYVDLSRQKIHSKIKINGESSQPESVNYLGKGVFQVVFGEDLYNIDVSKDVVEKIAKQTITTAVITNQSTAQWLQTSNASQHEYANSDTSITCEISSGTPVKFGEIITVEDQLKLCTGSEAFNTPFTYLGKHWKSTSMNGNGFVSMYNSKSCEHAVYSQASEKRWTMHAKTKACLPLSVTISKVYTSYQVGISHQSGVKIINIED